MNWSSQKTKNYLHMAAERDLSRVLRLLLDRARSTMRLKTKERNILRYFSGRKESSRRKQQNLIGQGYHQVLKCTVLKWRNGWLLIIYNFSVHLSAKFLSESCLKAFMEAGFRLINKFITYKTITYNIFTQVLYHNQMLLTDAKISFFKYLYSKAPTWGRFLKQPNARYWPWWGTPLRIFRTAKKVRKLQRTNMIKSLKFKRILNFYRSPWQP